MNSNGQMKAKCILCLGEVDPTIEKELDMPYAICLKCYRRTNLRSPFVVEKLNRVNMDPELTELLSTDEPILNKRTAVLIAGVVALIVAAMYFFYRISMWIATLP